MAVDFACLGNHPLHSMAHYSPDSYQPEESLGFLLRQASLSLERSLGEELQRLCPEVTVAQWAVLMKLGFGQCSTAAELAAAMNYDLGAMTRMVERLWAKGLVSREQDPRDRRVVRLALADKGRELFPTLPKAAVNVLNRRLDSFSAEEVEQMKRFLVRLLAPQPPEP